MNSLTWSDFACSRNDIFIYLEAVFMHKKKQQQKKLSGKKKKNRPNEAGFTSRAESIAMLKQFCAYVYKKKARFDTFHVN